jgi:hypothetical protein
VIESRPMEGKRQCFVIAPIGADGTDVRKRSDQVLKHIVQKVLGDRYKVERADEIGLPGIITVQVIERLFSAELVVADLSDGNPNVYYELALRHVAKKPVVHLISKGQDAPFDVSQIRYIEFDMKDPDSIERAQEQLREQVEAIEKGHRLLTPVQFAHLRSRRRQDNTHRAPQSLFRFCAQGHSTTRNARRSGA